MLQHPLVLNAIESAGYHREVDSRHPDPTEEHGVDIVELLIEQ